MVAEKYQTGFDQPLLQTMYVVKTLGRRAGGADLSRLNRTAPGKDAHLCARFRNEEDDIYKAFKPYYETTPDRRERRSAEAYRNCTTSCCNRPSSRRRT